MGPVWLAWAAVMVLLLAGPQAWAEPTSYVQAGEVVAGWLRVEPTPLHTAMGATVGQIETFADEQGQAVYYVVHVEPTGLVIVPADDRVEPIVAFVDGDRYEASPRNPLYALVQQDMAGRVAAARVTQQMGIVSEDPSPLDEAQAAAQEKWRRLSIAKDLPDKRKAFATSIPDVRVAPLIKSTWSQQVVGDIGGQPACYNYYTPPSREGTATNYPCGCVATAMAQLMRYHEYPSVGIGQHPFSYTVEGTTYSGNTRGGNGVGGAYDWSEMPLQPNGGTTVTQRKQIGAICWDAGIAVAMDYAPEGSGADMDLIASAMKTTFRYSNAVLGTNNEKNIGTALDSMINPGLDGGRPAILGICDSGPGSGHAILVDGYGYSGSTLYHHLNMGWSGECNVWYDLPDVDCSIDSYSVVYRCIYNIYPTGAGELISGRVTTFRGNPISGATVTATRSGKTYTAVSNAKGIYALGPVPSGATFSVSVTATEYTFAGKTVKTGTSQDNSTACGNRWKVDFAAAEGGPEPTLYVLTVEVSGPGADAPAQQSYPEGSLVDVSAPDAQAGAQFDHWSGDIGNADENALSIQVLMDRNRTITPHYTSDAQAGSSSGGCCCGNQVGAGNLIAFYAVCWAGLGFMKRRGRMQP